MAVADPKQARRLILTVLYESYQRDPMFMMTPSDMADASALLMDDLAPNCHYLHERDLIELIMGYNPPLFAAARIAPEGIDLYEDRTRFERFFSRGPGARSEDTLALIPLLMSLAQEAESARLDGLRREWLLRDVTHLRDLVRGPEKEWDADAIVTALGWLKGFTQDGVAMPSLDKIGDLMMRRYRQR
jgi:hypothetical protein